MTGIERILPPGWSWEYDPMSDRGVMSFEGASEAVDFSGIRDASYVQRAVIDAGLRLQDRLADARRLASIPAYPDVDAATYLGVA